MAENNILNYSLKLSSSNNVRFLKFRKFFLERDILTIAFAIFELEKELKKGENIEKLVITIDNKTFTRVKVNILEGELEGLLQQILLKKIEVRIESKDLSKFRRKGDVKFKKVENLCLFSGGTDSFSGILNSKRILEDIEGIFIAHGDQQKSINIVNHLEDSILKKKKIPLRTINVPKIGKGGYSQLRGFLYFASAAIYLNLLNSKKLIITECGPTMYQSKFSPYDSITMTTHPIVLKKSKKIIELLLNRKIELVIPFEDMTKAEVIGISQEKSRLKESHSCVSQLFRTSDGTCYGCVIRRLGMILNGIKDCDYKRDFITDESANRDNLLSLMRFCYDVLFDYSNLNLFSKENIEAYNKLDLFKRFALDTFASLFLVSKMKGEKISNIPMYKEAIEKLGEETLNKRIKEVRENKKLPDFNKRVK